MKPIQKTSIIDQVVDSLLEFIASDRVKIGDKMPTEQELCCLLYTSITNDISRSKRLKSCYHLHN